VSAITSERPGLQRIEADGRPAYVLTDVIGPVEVGHIVVLNTTAMDRGLGTGGFDVVHWNLSRSSVDLVGPGHVMKARYTSVQLDAGTWDTDDGPHGADGPHDVRALVKGTVVLGCQLHSHAVGLAAAIAAHSGSGAHVGFVMTDSAALPLALSDNVAAAQSAGVLGPTATIGQAFGGVYEAVTAASAVAACRVGGARIVIIGPGPGHVGTADELSFSGIDLVGHLDLLARLGATTGLAIRWSSVDTRPRHRGLSHHSATLLDLFARSHAVAVATEPMAIAVQSAAALATAQPIIEHYEPIDVAAALSQAAIAVASMGRAITDDPEALAALGSAARWAATVAQL
jgi:hypothetical protein